MRRLLRLAMLPLLVLPASAWWETGHEVVARIAANQLSPAAQTRVARILGVPDNGQAVADALAAASIWADHMKGQTKTGSWHYIDLELGDVRGDEPKRCPDQNCLPARIAYFEELLEEHPARTENQTDTRWTEAEALQFLVHFVGDAAQPLHTIDDDDLGGNCELLEPPVDRARNLHALWDGGIVGAMNETDRQLASDMLAQIERMPEPERVDLAGGKPLDWIWDSHEIARKDIYDRLHVPVERGAAPASCSDAPTAIREFHPAADAAYVNAMIPVVRLQLIKGGLRLGRLLNEIL